MSFVLLLRNCTGTIKGRMVEGVRSLRGAALFSSQGRSLAVAVLMFVAIFFCGIMTDSAHGATVRVTSIDGRVVEGEWKGASKGDGLRVVVQLGVSELSRPVDALSFIEFGLAVEMRGEKTQFFLADGGSLLGDLKGGNSEGVIVSSLPGDSLTISFDRLAGILFSGFESFDRSNELFDEAMKSRLPAQDVLITRSQEEPKAIRGRVETMWGAVAEGKGEDGGTGPRGSFHVGGRSRSFLLEKTHGVVFAEGAGKKPKFQAKFVLSDGSSFHGAIESSSAEAVVCTPSFGEQVTIPISQMQRIEFRSERVVYLSDLEPTAARMEGLVSAPWEWRKDKSVSGDVLSLDGKVHPRGIGVRARTELDYQLDGPYACFAATIGIDDSVRPLGTVEFRVSGDGRLLLEGGLISGKDRARDVMLDVSGVKVLTLMVDYGDGLDVSDHADWANARLIKKASDGEEACAVK